MKIVYAVADGINFKPEDPNWDISQIAFDCMTKSIYPDILFVTEEECLKKTVIFPMGGNTTALCILTYVKKVC